MKKYLLFVIMILSLYAIYDYFIYYNGNIYISNNDEITYFSKAQDEALWIDRGDGFEVFDIRGVNLGLGKPGKYATEYGITKEEYLRWFKQIQEMGANVIRTYTLAHEDFYEAFYEYNINNENPLYLIHGVWVDDYLLNSSYSAIDKEFFEPFLDECKNIVDVIHGKHKSNKISSLRTQKYKYDISPWVYGYILGIEWESNIVLFTDKSRELLPQYEGKYLYTEDASNFEIFLASIGDKVIEYESEKYGIQRVVAFSNWATTDPFLYPMPVEKYFKKYACIDVEKIKSTDKFLSKQFASYHIYPYYPDYLRKYENPVNNTYLQYLSQINDHHSMPVVISEFGVPSSRGMASDEKILGRNQGFMSEKQQGEAIVSMYKDIKTSGSAGGIVFTWQDEWFKRTWNTMANIDLNSTPYWSDYQTNEQYFGLLSFDPGKKQSICYVDGYKSDWDNELEVVGQDGYKLYMKYDEKFIYFLVEKEGFNIEKDVLFIPIDVTPKSGTTKVAEPYKLQTDKETDFIISIDGTNSSRVLVHQRYNTINALFSNLKSNNYLPFVEHPDKNSAKFEQIELFLQEDRYFFKNGNDAIEIPYTQFNVNNINHYSIMKTYETGKLTYGNANPKSDEFNSLADFCSGDGFVEIKIPWQLLNFADPSQMKIHDDYYEHYGVEYLNIDKINVGIGNGSKIIKMNPFNLDKLGKKPDYHERLKSSYYILQDYWISK